MEEILILYVIFLNLMEPTILGEKSLAHVKQVGEKS